MTCSSCGKSNIDTAKFCAKCGGKLSPAAAPLSYGQPAPSQHAASVIPPTGNTRPCPKCGHDNPIYAGFCAFCASDLSAPAAPAVQPAQAYQQAPVAQPPAQYQQAPVEQQPAQYYQQTPVEQQPAHAYQQAPVEQQPVQAYQQTPVEQQPVQYYQQAPVEQQPAQAYQQTPVEQQAAQYYQQAQVEQQPTQAYQQAPQQQWPAQGYQQTPPQQPGGFTAQPVQAGKKPSKLGPILVVLLLVLGLGAGGAFYMFGKYRASKLSSVQPVTPAATVPNPTAAVSSPVPTPMPTVQAPDAATTAPIQPIVSGPTVPTTTVSPSNPGNVSPIKPIAPVATATPEPKLTALEPSGKRPHQEARHYTSSYSQAKKPVTEQHHTTEVAEIHHPSTSGSHVHILSSSNEQIADRLASALKQRGFNVHVKKSGGSWSVDTAPSKNSGENSSTAQALRKSGYSAGVTSN